MDAFFSLLKKIERWLLIVLMILLAIFCFMQVFWRLILNDPLSWSEEVSRYLFVWLTFVGAAVAVGEWGHFQVDVLIGKLSPGAMLAFRWFAYLAIAFFAVMMLGPGWTLLAKISNQLSPAMRISMSLPYAALPISGALMLLHLVQHIHNDLRGKKAVAAQEGLE
jgi:TRAP-type C4-dicarboxylate transport system permease small subunit